jgi:hypothetical protein
MFCLVDPPFNELRTMHGLAPAFNNPFYWVSRILY